MERKRVMQLSLKHFLVNVNVNVSSRSLYAVARPSAVHLSSVCL